MKKTLITLMTLALASVAQAAYVDGVSISSSLTMPTSGMGTSTMTGLSVTSYASAYTFSFTVTGPVSTDSIVAAYWNSSKTSGGTVAFIIDSNTQTLNIDLLRQSGTTWTSFDSSASRQATFTESNTAVTLTAGYTYTVTLDADDVTTTVVNSNNQYTLTPTLTWTDANNVLHTATASYLGNMNGDGSSSGSIVVNTIPEPATATLSLLALASLAARRRRK